MVDLPFDKNAKTRTMKMTRESVLKYQDRSQNEKKDLKFPQGKQDQDGTHFLSIDSVTILTLRWNTRTR